MARPKGSPNKATAAAREAIARFVDGNATRVQEWLDAIERKDGPAAAYRCWLDLVEYHVPKLARTEHANADGQAFKQDLNLNVIGIPSPER